ncbi:hypothetical protein [Pseudoxanthomonas mexicana]|uniref:hypothetical protein n=1 Tax=Pseudoxanthomonas mexicana TaxID=128785 RepID=UPI0028A755A2|nr:hypothetical protein [Pseudoxanthomonas mexicana]
MAEPWEENYATEEDGPWNDFAPTVAPRHRRGSRAGATMAGSLNTPNVQGKNVAPPPKGNRVTRALGEIGGRETMQAAYGLYGMLGGDALNEYVLSPLDRAIGWGDQLGIGNQTYRDAAAAQADEWGMRRPQTATQRVVADIGEGLAGTGLTMGIGGLVARGAQGAQTVGNAVRSKLGDFLTANPVTQTAATIAGTGSASVGREHGAGPLTQLALGMGGSAAAGGSVATLEGLARGAARGTNPTQFRQNVEDFARVGTTPSVGQASGRRSVQGVENLLAASPTAEGVMVRASERQSAEIGAGLDRLANNLSRNPSAENAGRAIEEGAKTFGRNVSAVRKALYWQVDKLIPRNASVQLPNTWRTIVQLTTPTKGAENTTGDLISPVMTQLRESLAKDVANGGGKIPYDALKQVRSRIGEEMDASILVNTRETAQYKQLYRALSRDMEEAAKLGGPAAERAARRANTFTRVSADRLEDVQRVIDKNGGPEAIYNAAMQGTRDGGTTIRKVMQSIDKNQQRAVTAAFLRRMGMANPNAQDATGEVFSARTFLTNWNKVSPEAKRALFDRHGPRFSEDMDRIARVAENIDKGSTVFKNPSGTGNRTAAIGYWLALGNAVYQQDLRTAAGVAGLGVTLNRLAHKMTDPEVVHWLAETTRYPAAATFNSQLQALRQIGEREEDPEILELADALEEQARNQ